MNHVDILLKFLERDKLARTLNNGFPHDRVIPSVTNQGEIADAVTWALEVIKGMHAEIDELKHDLQTSQNMEMTLARTICSHKASVGESMELGKARTEHDGNL